MSIQIQSYKYSGIIFIVLSVLALSTFPASATIFSENGSNVTASDLYNLTNSTTTVPGNISPAFFFDPDCGACGPAHEYIEAYVADHPGIDLHVVNLSTGNESQDLLNAYYGTYNREWMNIPVAFIGPMGLEGTDEVINNFDGLHSWYESHKDSKNT
nr:hypothetical protein [uncultured Methanospirillum sp.]